MDLTRDRIADVNTQAANKQSKAKIFIDGLKYALNPRNILSELTDWKPGEWALLAVLVGVQAAAFIVSADYSANGWIGLVTGVFTIFSLVLVNKGRLTNYVWGFIACAAWLVISIQNWLIGDIFSQSFYVIMNVVGVYFWQKQINQQADGVDDHVEARKMEAWRAVIAFIGTIVLYFVVVAISMKSEGNQVWLDGALLPLGIAGQTLMTFGYRSQWAAWIAVDVINVIIWGNQLAAGGPAALSMLVLQVAMLANALYGTWCWFHSGEEIKTADGADVEAE